MQRPPAAEAGCARRRSSPPAAPRRRDRRRCRAAPAARKQRTTASCGMSACARASSTRPPAWCPRSREELPEPHALGDLAHVRDACRRAAAPAGRRAARWRGGRASACPSRRNRRPRRRGSRLSSVGGRLGRRACARAAGGAPSSPTSRVQKRMKLATSAKATAACSGVGQHRDRGAELVDGRCPGPSRGRWRRPRPARGQSSSGAAVAPAGLLALGDALLEPERRLVARAAREREVRQLVRERVEPRVAVRAWPAARASSRGPTSRRRRCRWCCAASSRQAGHRREGEAGRGRDRCAAAAAASTPRSLISASRTLHRRRRR